MMPRRKAKRSGWMLENDHENNLRANFEYTCADVVAKDLTRLIEFYVEESTNQDVEPVNHNCNGPNNCLPAGQTETAAVCASDTSDKYEKEFIEADDNERMKFANLWRCRCVVKGLNRLMRPDVLHRQHLPCTSSTLTEAEKFILRLRNCRCKKPRPHFSSNQAFGSPRSRHGRWKKARPGIQRMNTENGKTSSSTI